MSNDEHDALPPSYAPASGSRRPNAEPPRTVGPGQETSSPRPRRQPQGGAPQRKSIRQPQADDGAGSALPPSYAPAARGRPSAISPDQATCIAPRTSSAVRAPDPRPGSPDSSGPASRRRKRRRPIVVILLLILAVLIAWPVGLLVWANGKIQHTEALSGAPGTPGTTYLLAGSDSRSDGAIPDGTEGQRSDTIMVMHVPDSGTPSLISLPRDTYVEIPGNGMNKLNASYSIGGAPLLVQTVEGVTGLTVDHYVEIGMGGVQNVVDAVGGVELCLDSDVQDELSALTWTAGCHQADGPTALAFARMRYSDPLGDIGRSARQRQVVAAVVKEVT
ncbi:LCP family protein, partial [Georgenia sp.]